MKIPGLGKIATFALNKIVLPAIGKAIADRTNSMTKQSAKDAVVAAIEAEAARQVKKRMGG